MIDNISSSQEIFARQRSAIKLPSYISNLSLISKIIERIVKSRLIDYLSSNTLLYSRQSVYSKHRSTETAAYDHLISVKSFTKSKPPIISF